MNIEADFSADKSRKHPANVTVRTPTYVIVECDRCGYRHRINRGRGQKTLNRGDVNALHFLRDPLIFQAQKNPN